MEKLFFIACGISLLINFIMALISYMDGDNDLTWKFIILGIIPAANILSSLIIVGAFFYILLESLFKSIYKLYKSLTWKLPLEARKPHIKAIDPFNEENWDN